MNNERLGADEHSIMGGEIGIMCVALESLPELEWTFESYFDR